MIFGFNYPENFQYPYIASSITDFWRRWHISLSSWFREYVYIPLGGNRCSLDRWLANLLIVWIVTGIWHGSSLNYLIWAFAYYLLLVLEKIVVHPEGLKTSGKIWYRFISIILIILLWVVFKLNDSNTLRLYFKAMFGLLGNPIADKAFLFQFRNIFFMLIIAIIGATPMPKLLYVKIPHGRIEGILSCIGIIMLAFISFTFILMETYNPFLYFAF